MKNINSDSIRKAVEKHRQDIVDWTKTFVAYPSENRPPTGNEADAQTWIVEQCKEVGLEVDRFSPLSIPRITEHPHWLSGRDYPPGRENVVAQWNGKKSATEKTILLSGHCDVAPFEPDDWKVCRPFEPKVVDNRLYGRGSADMKGGLATAYWAIRILKELAFEPNGTIIFESIVDEEFAGGNGTLASRLKGYNGDLAVCLEPSGMDFCTAGLGAFLGDFTVTGEAGMPYTGHTFSNPIFGIGRVAVLFEKWIQEWRANNDHNLFDPESKPLNVVLWGLTSDAEGEASQMGTPQISRLSWIVWCHPGTDEARFYSEFRKFWEKQFAHDPILQPFAYEITPTYHFVEPWESDSSDPMIQALADTFAVHTGSPTKFSGGPFSSDMAIYGRYGNMPTVILGPRGDNLHGPDEWVNIDDLIVLTSVLADFMVKQLG